MANIMANIQQLGRTLMLPIAVLPVAALLLRLGQPDLLNIAFVAAAGDAIFANLGMLFAIGIAVGLAKNNHGAAGLAGLVAYLVALHGVQTLVEVPATTLANIDDALKGVVSASYKVSEVKGLRVPIGILSGVCTGILYNRYHAIKLPEFLAFFGGRRFVPIAAGIAGVFLAAIIGYGFPYISAALDTFSTGVVNAGGVGLFIFGLLNRLLIVTGLHHVLNNVAWFILGDYNGTTGDLNRFFAGDKTAGAFMTGFFPVMMFGLPAACYAMYRSARPERRKEVGGMYVSLGLTSLLTGVTEPIEFTFMFLAPLLYAIHAVLTGISMVIMDFLNIKLGFGFSAGLFDFILNYNQATRPLLLLPIGLIYAGLYYSIFRFFIIKFDLQVPGRDRLTSVANTHTKDTDDDSKARAFIKALGGASNLTSVEACTTRLRLILNDNTIVDEPALKGLGARGMIRPTATSLQVVLGPQAELVSDDINRNLAPPNTIDASQNTATTDNAVQFKAVDEKYLEDLKTALGGVNNIQSCTPALGRILLHLKSTRIVEDSILTQMGIRGIAHLKDEKTHLLLGPELEGLAQQLAAHIQHTGDTHE